MQKIEHIGIAVQDLTQSILIYEALLNTTCYKTEEVAAQHVNTAFLRSGTNKIELVAATDPSSPIAKFIDKKGEGIHHIAFAVTDIHQEMERLAAQGFRLLNDKPVRGADNKLICFIHPKSANGVLIELCQTIP